MSRRVVAAAALAALVAAGAGAVWALRGEDDRPGRFDPFEARVSLSPRTHLFGDPVTAEIAIELDRDAVDPRSVRVRTRFAPYAVVRRDVDQRTADDVVSLLYRFSLLCLRPACLAQQRLPVAIELDPVDVRYRLHRGASRRRTLPWPRSEIGSRLGTVELESLDLSRPWRASLTPPPPSYRADPRLVAAAVYGAALLLAAFALALLAPAVRRALRVAPRRKDPLAGLPPLERALVLLQRALAAGTPEEQRKALDRLARELRRHGDVELAHAAGRLAWSPPAPAGDELGALTGRVRETLGGRR